MDETEIRVKVSIGNLLTGLERLVYSGRAQSFDLCESDAKRLEKVAREIRELIGKPNNKPLPHNP